MLAPDGKKLVHGELAIGGHRVFVVDEFPAMWGPVDAQEAEKANR